MKSLSFNEKGFTLIELAIVMVIIGILIGAVLKGQDLIQNARAKKFVTKVRAWEVATWSFYDRKGRFPGDSNKDGKIGDGDVKTDLTGANFINPPYEGSSGSETNTIKLGSYTFYVFFGTDGDPTATPATGKNIMVICASSNCSTSSFSSDELTYIEALDVALDGSADGTAGQAICDDGPTTVDSNKWVAYGGITAAACNTSAKAFVYYFDAKRQ